MNNQNCGGILWGLSFLLAAVGPARSKMFQKPFVLFAFLGLPFGLMAQSVSGIVTDYNGYWKSSAATPNSNKPVNDHNLLAFTFNGVQYSTGVNDPLLHQNGETFTAADFWSLPVGEITGRVNSQTKIGVGALYDGVANGAGATPPENDLRRYLTDGIKGLNIGTCVANLPLGTLNFYVHSINASEIGDGKPDIVVTQVADPSGNAYDRYEFTDENGNRVGNYKDIVFTSINPVGQWVGDFYEASTNPMTLARSFTQTQRDIRLWAADLSEFGLNASNIGQIRHFKINLSGISDVAFVAYNKNGMGIGVLPVKITSFKGSVTNDGVQLSWQTSLERQNKHFVVERSQDGQQFTAIGTVKSNGQPSYSFTDRQPLTGVSYYRLMQVDHNGAVAYSQVVQVKRAAAAPMQVYPNPGRGVFYINHPPAAVPQKLLVYNAYGALLGYKMTAPHAQQTTIDLRHLPSGTYYVTCLQHGTLQSVGFTIR